MEQVQQEEVKEEGQIVEPLQPVVGDVQMIEEEQKQDAPAEEAKEAEQ